MTKVELTHAKMAELKKKAAGCDPKYWIMDQHGDVVAVDFDNKGTKLKIASVDFLDDAEHIAAADPATVLAMVEEIEQLTKTSQELFDKTKALEQEIEQIKRQAENNVKHVPYYTGKGPLEQAIEILGTRELNKVIQSRKESEAGHGK